MTGASNSEIIKQKNHSRKGTIINAEGATVILNARKMSAEDMKKICGGTYEDAEPYLQELYAKYGLDEDQTEELIAGLTDVEFSQLWDLVRKR